MISTPVSTGVVSCACPGDKPWDSSALLCLYTSGCDNRCQSKCTVKASNSDCYLNCAANMVQSGAGPIYQCDCPSGKTYEPTSMLCAYSSGCDIRCGTYCTSQNDNTACLNSCASGMTQVGSPPTLTCNCPLAGQIIYLSTCVYSTSCDSRCGPYCTL